MPGIFAILVIEFLDQKLDPPFLIVNVKINNEIDPIRQSTQACCCFNEIARPAEKA